MKKNSKIPQCGVLPDISREKVVVGTKQLRKSLLKGQVQRVYLAENADPAITEPLAQMCKTFHVHITWVPSMTELGKVCGIEVGTAAAAVIYP